MADASAPDGPAPLHGGALALAAIALALGTFMQVLDSTIANVSIPTIAGNLGVSTDQGTWVITAFAVSNGISVPLTGWFMQRYGIVKTFVGSVLLFTFMSFLCGIAWNLPSLVLFRVLQGAVSGPMIPGSQALLIMIFPRERQASALAIWSMTTLVAPICGPILGGYISDNFSWPWIFLINLPVGLLCAFVCWRFLNSRETPTRKLPIDGVGFGLLVVWVGAFQIMLDTGKNADWFSSPAIVIEALVAVVGFLAWVIWEITEKHPVVDLSLFRSPNFALGTVAMCVGFAVFFANAVLLPLWLQTQMGYTATWAGLVAAPSGLVAVVLTPFVARIFNRIDARVTATFSIGAFALSFWMRSDYSPDADFLQLVWPMLVMGVGMSGFFISMVTLVLNGVSPQQVPQATGLTNFARISAGSFAAALTTTWWEQREALHQTHIADSTGGPTDPNWMRALHALEQQGASFAEATAALAHQVAHQAVYLATLDLFRLSAWVTLGLVPLIWLTKRAVGRGRTAAAAD
ncbi:MAG TPA: DHA2 family efflux MFS transporter permease subunit [Caulobacterales bacterium]|nr:DHA2 family efflux MFS transporter permease subunit [Caulobacterales bacterium]